MYSVVNSRGVMGPNEMKQTQYNNDAGSSGPNTNLDIQYMNDAGSKQQVYFDLVVHAPDHVQPMECKYMHVQAH
jgi:hypothetical protein